MYAGGPIACIFVVMLIGACGCSAIFPGSKAGTDANASESTPTLPARYVAGEETLSSQPVPVTARQTLSDIASLGLDSGVKLNITELAIDCADNSTCSNGTAYNSSADITALIVPDSSFTANITRAYVKQNPSVPVEFTAASNTAPYTWRWKWSGGKLTTSSDFTLVLVFNQYGYYTVSRTVKNSNSTASNSTQISVCPLVASFTASQTSGKVPLTVRFTDTSTDQPSSWTWDFGDGATSALQNPSHTYTKSGTYTVRLDAKNSLGSCWNTSTITVSSLAASFSASQTSGLAPLTVRFTDTSTDQPTAWTWDFGDGATSALQNPSHTYTTTGVYPVTLKVTNGYDGWIAASPSQIAVYSLPAVSFAAVPVTGTAGTTVAFTDTSTGAPTPLAWYWDFGDGYTSTYQSPSHQYAAFGVYSVNHSATNTQGTAWLNRTAYISIS